MNKSLKEIPQKTEMQKETVDIVAKHNHKTEERQGPTGDRGEIE